MLSHPTRGPRHAQVTGRRTLTSWLRDLFSTLIFTQGPQNPREGWERGRQGVGAYDQASPTGPTCTWSPAAGAAWARSLPLPHSGPQAALGQCHKHLVASQGPAALSGPSSAQVGKLRHSKARVAHGAASHLTTAHKILTIRMK